MLLLLTRHCTMDCPHCMVNATANGHHCHKSVVQKTLEFNEHYGIDRIVVSGGEPTEHPNFFSLFKMILSKSQRVYLATNGSFLFDPTLTTQMKCLLEDYKNFDIQITSIKGLYPKYKKIVPLYNKFLESLMPFDVMRVYLVQQLYFLDEKSGRAKKNNLSKFRTGNKRTGPECFNLYALACQLPSLEFIFRELQMRNFSHCKLVVWPDGTIRSCAAEGSPIIGNIHKDWEEVYYNLRSNRPCGRCGNPIPETYARKLGWR